jgi:hypothetical protein
LQVSSGTCVYLKIIPQYWMYMFKVICILFLHIFSGCSWCRDSYIKLYLVHPRQIWGNSKKQLLSCLRGTRLYNPSLWCWKVQLWSFTYRLTLSVGCPFCWLYECMAVQKFWSYWQRWWSFGCCDFYQS